MSINTVPNRIHVKAATTPVLIQRAEGLERCDAAARCPPSLLRISEAMRTTDGSTLASNPGAGVEGFRGTPGIASDNSSPYLPKIVPEVLFLRPQSAENRPGRGGTKNALVKVSRRTEGRSEEHTSELQSPCNLVCR